jgi:hypothetical protein
MGGRVGNDPAVFFAVACVVKSFFHFQAELTVLPDGQNTCAHICAIFVLTFLADVVATRKFART